MIVDLGATGSVVGRSALPAAAGIRPLEGVEVSERGVRRVGATVEAAGGAVGGFLGTASLPELRLGGLVIPEADVNVLDPMPEIGGRRFLGILGQNLLRRAARVRLTLPPGPGLGGKLELGGTALDSSRMITLPFKEAQRHLFVQGRVAGAPLSFLIDTGARRSTIPVVVAESAGLDLAAGEPLRGLDGAEIPTRSATGTQFELGNARFEDGSFSVVDVPVLERLGLGDGAGLLGMDFLRRFAVIEIDYESKVLRLLPANATETPG